MGKNAKDEKICGTCVYHRHVDGEWVCNNLESECYGCYTEYRDACNSWEEREPYQRFGVTIKSKKF